MSSNILLIEDEDFIRELYKGQLDLGGMSTDAFASGAKGLQALAEKKYDLVLLDIMLPDMNGLQILRLIKQNPETKDIPVVLLTNLSQDQVIKQGFKEGADAYLLKAALVPEEMIKEVQRILNKSAGNNTPS